VHSWSEASVFSAVLLSDITPYCSQINRLAPSQFSITAVVCWEQTWVNWYFKMFSCGSFRGHELNWRRCQFKLWVQFQFCMFGCFIPMNGPISQGHANTMAAALMGIWCSFKHDVQRSQPAIHCFERYFHYVEMTVLL